jgi:hypothetical protein
LEKSILNYSQNYLIAVEGHGIIKSKQSSWTSESHLVLWTSGDAGVVIYITFQIPLA